MTTGRIQLIRNCYRHYWKISRIFVEMLEFHHEWSPDASRLAPWGHMEVPFHPQLHSIEMSAGNASSVLQERRVAGTTCLHRPALTCSLAKSWACVKHTSMGNHGIGSLPRHTELFWFETYDRSLLKEKIILSSLFPYLSLSVNC